MLALFIQGGLALFIQGGLATFRCKCGTISQVSASVTLAPRQAATRPVRPQPAVLNTRQDGPPQGGPQKTENKEKNIKKQTILLSKTRFWASPGRDISNHGGFFRFGTLRGTGKFRYIFRHFFVQIPIPIQAFASCGAGSHAFLSTGHVLELRIYVVGAAGGPSFGPKSKFSSFSGVPGKTHHPALCESLYLSLIHI